jgi:hypothetical protein
MLYFTVFVTLQRETSLLYEAEVERRTAHFIIGFTLLSSFMQIIEIAAGSVVSA